MAGTTPRPHASAGSRSPTRAELLELSGRSIEDVIAPDLQVLFCGINPGLYTAWAGHHFARPGNRFWPALHRSGFTPRQLAPAEQEQLLGLGLGVTAYRAAFGLPKAGLGLQTPGIGATRVWVLPNPSGLDAHYPTARLAELFADLRRVVEAR